MTIIAQCGAALLLVGCGADHQTGPTDPSESTVPSFDFALSGDATSSTSARSLVQFAPGEWTEISNGGTTKYTSDVTTIASISSNIASPSASLGLLGKPVVGTYRVRVAGSAFGTTPEFYGSVGVSHSDGSSTLFWASSGTITITSVSPVVRGTFSFHSNRSTTLPANVVVGTTVESVPASLDVSGSFVAKLP